MNASPLRPNPERWQRLHLHLGYATGHSVIVLLFPSVNHARAACEVLGTELQEKGSALLVLPERPVPQLPTLLDSLLSLEIPSGTGTVWLPLYAEDTRADLSLRSDALRHALSALNRQRNVLARRIPRPLILAGTFDLQDALQSAAPDLWSVRAGVIEFLPDASPGDYAIQRSGESTESFPNLDDAPDPELALATAAELENKFHHAIQDNLPDEQANGYFTEWLQYLARAARGWLGRHQPEKANDVLDLALCALRHKDGPPPETQDRGALGSLSTLLRSMGRISDALRIVHQMLEIRERTLGRDHRQTLISVNNLAELYRNQGDYAKAEPLYERALEAQERTLGREHPHTLTSVHNLALLFYNQSDYAKAEPLLERALEARERTLGPDHPDTLMSMMGVALLYHKQGDYAKAQPLYERALEALERTLGREHPQTLANVNNLAGFLHERGSSAQALPLMLRAVEGRERVLGPQHPNTVNSRNWLDAIRKAVEQGGQA